MHKPEDPQIRRALTVPRPNILGVTTWYPQARFSVRQLVAYIAVAYGGQVAEERFCGHSLLHASDMDKINRLAREAAELQLYYENKNTTEELINTYMLNWLFECLRSKLYVEDT
ncbi:hypothetical protein GPALN_006955 [Globodera pallida]|nr:hypothetical protein GPALN_006955 [Globodera pallida]